MTPTIVFVHGGWVTPRCWDPFVSYFEARDYRCLAPAWPGKDRTVDEIRMDPSPLSGLGIREIVDHYEQIVRSLDEPPILIGHSFGGLFVQMLLDRGLGAAGIAIDSGAPKGVFALEPTSLISLGRILAIPFGWRKVVRWSFREFRYAFVHTTSAAEQRAIWESQIIPDSGRPFFEAGFAMLPWNDTTRVDFANPNRAPLLFVSGDADRAIPPAVVRRQYRAHLASPARTDFRSFSGRTHWLIAQSGWEEVARAASIGSPRSIRPRRPLSIPGRRHRRSAGRKGHSARCFDPKARATACSTDLRHRVSVASPRSGRRAPERTGGRHAGHRQRGIGFPLQAADCRNRRVARVPGARRELRLQAAP